MKSAKNIVKLIFDMKDVNLVGEIVGLNITWASERTILSQSHYINKILKM